jgi:acyl dehydratase
MTNDDAGPANRWATEHYGFADEPAHRDAPAADAAVKVTGETPSEGGRPRSGRRAGLIASGVLSLALVAGIGGAAVAAGDAPGAGRDGLAHVHDGDGRGGRGGDR